MMENRNADVRTYAMQKMVEYLCRYYHANENQLFEILVTDKFQEIRNQEKRTEEGRKLPNQETEYDRNYDAHVPLFVRENRNGTKL